MRSIIYVVAVAAVASAATYSTIRQSSKAPKLETFEMGTAAVEMERRLIGYTQYTNYLAVGKMYLSGKSKLIVATVVRDERLTQAIERRIIGMSFTGVVLVTYRAEYSFGFDLRSDQYDIRAVESGIEVRLKRPSLVVTPSVTHLKHKVLSGSVMTDERAAVLSLYEQATTRVDAQGSVMALEPQVMALCERQLMQVLRDFIAKQPGVAFVPNISIVYTDAVAS